ncbi:TPA: hypothetical protein HA231_01750 [Candidatus Woesearchaeota archaeon]|nr:hypothetical protein [Candidatus Woesearchaeota archaeon]
MKGEKEGPTGRKVSSETPLLELTLRKYEKPQTKKERELVKKLCLSLGVLQPGDSRDVVVDVLHVLLKGRKRKQLLNVEDIEARIVSNRKLHKLAMQGIAPSNIRRQLKRLRNLMLVEKVKSRYRVSEFLSMSEIFAEKIEKFLLQGVLQRVKEYLVAADEIFTRK